MPSTEELKPILGTVIGQSTVEVLRDRRLRSCRRPSLRVQGRRRRHGRHADGLRDRLRHHELRWAPGRARARWPVAATGFALIPSPPWRITRGQVLAVLPFGDTVVTLDVNGAELKTMLENGVSRMPAADGRFPQVSGLCFTYDISATAGSRVTGAVRQAADGTCTGASVDLTAASMYHIAENDFMVTAGDGSRTSRAALTRARSWIRQRRTTSQRIRRSAPRFRAASTARRAGRRVPRSHPVGDSARTEPLSRWCSAARFRAESGGRRSAPSGGRPRRR